MRVALVTHGAFFGLLLFLSLIKLQERPNPRANARPVVLRPLSSQQWAQNRGDQKAEESPQLAKTIAREIGAQTLVFDPLEGLTDEELAAGKDYASVMRENLANLRIALQCQ
jgi:zinc transport system substrate-binding protein